MGSERAPSDFAQADEPDFSNHDAFEQLADTTNDNDKTRKSPGYDGAEMIKCGDAFEQITRSRRKCSESNTRCPTTPTQSPENIDTDLLPPSDVQVDGVEAPMIPDVLESDSGDVVSDRTTKKIYFEFQPVNTSYNGPNTDGDQFQLHRFLDFDVVHGSRDIYFNHQLENQSPVSNKDFLVKAYGKDINDLNTFCATVFSKLKRNVTRISLKGLLLLHGFVPVSFLQFRTISTLI